MKEREQILHLYREMREQGSAGVLVTVVKTLGSSYRRPGARLLLAENGKRAGSISGGCLEDDVIKKAWWLTEKGPVIRRYDTTPDGEIGPMAQGTGGFGLGCNGIIYLLLDRVSFADSSPLAILEQVYATRRPALLQHVLTPLDSAHEAFLETLTPPVRLLVFGAGDDAAPLTELARYLGWQVSVFDGRAHYARREKFPHAHQVTVHNSAESLDSLHIDSRTVAVVMTHSYSQDLNFIKHLAKTPLAYLGILGPRSRSAQLLIDAEIEPGLVPSLHGPAGLDIGADGPEQVALSIIAEIQAAMNGRQGGSLRTRAGSIHSTESDGLSSAPFVPSIVCA
jgi:xanthine/CO dehydrogenase XdhC/CoxF family maturation factor